MVDGEGTRCEVLTIDIGNASNRRVTLYRLVGKQCGFVVSGLACCTQNYLIVLVGSLAICAILFLFKKIASNISKYVIVIRGKNINLSKVEAILKNNLNSFLCKGKYFDKENVELIYDVKYKGKQNDNVIKELYQIEGIEVVNLVASNTDTMG